MPAFLTLASLAPVVAVIIRFFVGYMITRTITILGLTLITYKGINLAGDYISGYLYAGINSLGSDFISAFSAVGGFNALAVILAAENSALIIRLALGSASKLTFGRVAV